MSQNALRDFFREKQSKSRARSADSAALRKEWLAAIDAFYLMIVDDYLGTAKKEVKHRFEEKPLHEAHLGDYVARDLVLQVGDEEVRFSPKARNVVGSTGRIDVQAERGEATIVRQRGNRWSIVVSRMPALKLVPVTPKSLSDMLRNIMRP